MKRNSNRTRLARLVVAVAVFVTLGVSADRRPNVILLITDDQGYGDIAAHGNPDIQTPELDRLHAESVRFDNFHVDPTCSPTRAALMTGRYSSRVGVWHTFMGRNFLRRDEVIMADMFAASGYRTAMFGKWHLGDNYPYRPEQRGFQETLVHGGGVVGETPDYWGNSYCDDTYFRNGVPEKVSGYCTDVWFREAIRFVERNRAHPFFLYIATNAPHGPLNVPRRYVEPYLAQGVPETRARMYGMVAAIDENLGALRRRLAGLDLDNETIFIFMTDNGTANGVTLKAPKGERNANGFPVSGFNAGMRGRKTSPYEGGHRGACFFRWSGGGWRHGRNVEQLTAHLDLPPTLVELCRLDSPAAVRFDGKSLVPLLRGETSDWPVRTLFVHEQRVDQPVKWKDVAVMTDRWRLVGRELYDIGEDPGQENDIAAKHPQTVARLRAEYEKWWDSISTRFNEYTAIPVGDPQADPVLLNAQAWHGAVVPYDQQHVRAGLEANGFWAIEVVRGGQYEVSLRRWPEESDLAINSSVDRLFELDPARVDLNWGLYQPPSRAFQITRARLRIGESEWTKAVEPGDKAATFHVGLQPGETRLQTWFINEDGSSVGAYFVMLKRR